MARFTSNTLAAHIRGEIDQNPEAAGGDIPDRMMTIVRAAGVELWHAIDAKYRRKRGTLTTVASQAYAAVASDYDKLDQRWLKAKPSTTADAAIRFTSDVAEWQTHSDRFATAGEPELATMVQDTTQSTFTWYAMLAPVPDQVYTFYYWYLTNDPWTVAAAGWTDDSSPLWPSTFDEGWLLNALWKCQRAFCPDDRWKSTKAMYDDWLNRQRAENDEILARNDDTIQDGYQDIELLTGVNPDIYRSSLL